MRSIFLGVVDIFGCLVFLVCSLFMLAVGTYGSYLLWPLNVDWMITALLVSSALVGFACLVKTLRTMRHLARGVRRV